MRTYFKYILSSVYSKKAFTLVELMVVIAIATIMVTAVVVQQSSWNDSLAVRTQAYELVLMLRQAQIYSLGVREDIGGTGDKFNMGYGVHFDTNGPLSERYVFFADRNGNSKYDSTPTDEAIETKILTRGVKVNKVCAAVLNPCPNNGPKEVDVTFLRPLPSARLNFLDNSGVPISPQPSSPAFLKIQSANGLIVVVKIEANGQISMQ